jgi:molybdate transport system substrate-binding protein
MPGDDLYVDLAIERSLADASTRLDLAYFIPVIQVKKGNPLGISTLHDLTKPGIRVGLGDPRSVAVGKKTLKILEKSGVDSSKLTSNLIYHSGTVTELAAAVELGTIDAAIVWDATARNHERTCDTVMIPWNYNVLATVPIVLLKTTNVRKEALAFAAFAASDKGKRIFAACRYTTKLPAAVPVETGNP